MSAVLIIGSVQLFVIGIFGEYLGRMFMEVKGRPLFIVEQVVRGSELAAETSSPSDKLFAKEGEIIESQGHRQRSSR